MKQARFIRKRLHVIVAVFAATYGLASAQTQDATISYQYDANGNMSHIKDALGNLTTLEYDALNRMFRQTQPIPTVGQAAPVITYAYDGLDQLAFVKDPRGLFTYYTVDGLGNQNVVQSPDAGATTKTYDNAGNLKTTLDAKSQKTTYDYDELNRLKKITYHDSGVTIFTYDQSDNGIGRLTQVADANSTTSYAYDQMGRLRKETRTINKVDYVTRYDYDTYGLSSITYPSSRVLNYVLDKLGRVQQIETTKDGATQTLVRDVTYHRLRRR